MFKVGDKGKTRGGWDYEIISVNEKRTNGGKDQPIRAIIDGDADYWFNEDGTYDNYSREGAADLMPPVRESSSVTLSDYTHATWQEAVKDFALLLIEGYNAPDAQQIARAALVFTGDEE